MSDYDWKVGQEVAISRKQVAVISKVTASGRAVVGSRIFNKNGTERTNSGAWRRDCLEPFTAEIKSEMDLVKRGRIASLRAEDATNDAQKWLRQTFSSYAPSVPDPLDVEKAERLSEAIDRILGVVEP